MRHSFVPFTTYKCCNNQEIVSREILNLCPESLTEASVNAVSLQQNQLIDHMGRRQQGQSRENVFALMLLVINIYSTNILNTQEKK